MTRHLNIVGFLLGMWVFSCAGYAIDWEGSVDAVFRYRPQDSTTAVVEIRENSFSEEAGLKAGDLILAVDGTNLAGSPFEEVRTALRGPVGSVVHLTIKRNDAVMDIAVERRPVKKK